jgi:hypothetical protein
MWRRVTALLVLPLSASALSAQINTFLGTWKNVDPNAQGLTTLRIEIVGTNLKVRAWGKCSPSDCPWGETEGTPYGSDIHADVPQTARVISAQFSSKISQTLLVVHAAQNGRLQADVLKRYTDTSGRANMGETAVLVRPLPNAPEPKSRT